MSKYNVGDIVKLRDDLELYNKYDVWLRIKEKPVTITGTNCGNCYHQGTYVGEGIQIKSEDGLDYFIDESMIEGLWEECKEKQDKLKLIDVLNMIAKGELKEGTKVKYEGVEYTYKKFDSQDNDSTDLISDSSCSIFEDYFLTSLQDEVELIEPPCVGTDKTIEPTKIEGLDIDDYYNVTSEGEVLDIEYAILDLVDKLNEVIRKINKE